MAIDKKYINHFINFASKAALASSFLVGKKNKIEENQRLFSCIYVNFSNSILSLIVVNT